jgi:hypothetical protein
MDSRLVEYKEVVLEKGGVNNTYYSSESICGKIDDYHLKVSITKRTSILTISRKFYVIYWTKKRHGVANVLSTM